MPKSEIPLHPGKILYKKFLFLRSISISQFAKLTKISKKHVKEIIKGKRSISKNTAKIFAKHLNTDPDYWIELQSLYDIHIAKKLLKGIIPENDNFEEIMVNNPHDKLIKIVFSDRSEAVDFFQKNLPPHLVSNIDWDTLELEGSKYIDEELKDSESDILYSVYFKDSNDKFFLYLLFEHQSTPDKWLRFRLIKYKTRIWDESFNKYKDQEMLIPILSMVFYIGSSAWNYSSEFSDLIYETYLDAKYIPKFEHFLWDFSSKSKELKGAIKAKIAHLLIQAHFHGKLKNIYQILLKYFGQIKQIQGINYIKVFFIYIASTQKQNELKNFIQFIRNENRQKGGQYMLSILEELKSEGRKEGRRIGRRKGRKEGRKEGRREGKLKEKIDIIENMLSANLDWQLINKITGVDNKRFEDIKTELHQLKINPVIAKQSLSKNKFPYSNSLEY